MTELPGGDIRQKVGVGAEIGSRGVDLPPKSRWPALFKWVVVFYTPSTCFDYPAIGIAGGKDKEEKIQATFLLSL